MLGMTLNEIEAVMKKEGLPAFRAKQIAQWLYKKHAVGWDEMTSLSISLRNIMAEKTPIGREPPQRMQESQDGTRKYLFPAGEKAWVETALISDGERKTICLSTQAGCRRACSFCFTARGGFQGDISTGTILNQYASCPERDDINNIVFMGMGEPFDNLDAVMRAVEIFTAKYGYAMSPTRLTVSTVGIIPGIVRYLDESRAHLAVSLNSPFAEQRAELMPSEKQYPIKDVLKVLRRYDWTGQRRLTFEYIMFAGINDSDAHAEAVASLLKGLECRVNLIAFNPGPGIDFQPSTRDAMERFQTRLKDRRVMTTIRKSKGQDIAAACGQLSGGQG